MTGLKIVGFFYQNSFVPFKQETGHFPKIFPSQRIICSNGALGSRVLKPFG